MTYPLFTKPKHFLAFAGCLLLFCLTISTSAQTVTGTVLSAADNQPLNGVTVQLVGTNHATTTDPSGNYRISNIPATGSLTFSYVGYKTETIPVSGRSKVDVKLQTEASSLDRVIVVGYGTVKKTDLTGSVANVDVDEMVKAPVASFGEALAGRVAGVQVNAGDGQPGAGVNIMIRGAGSLTQSTTPLYVVDGFPIENLDPATIVPEDIESISILKDASSTAIYGSRGANGVVLIQTKRGRAGRAVVSLNGSVGYQLPPPQIPMMSPYEFVKYQRELDPTSYATPEYFANGKTLEDYKNVEGINWQDEILQPGIYQDYYLAVRGGTDETKYSISGNLFDQQGVIINTGMKRYAGRMSIDQKISDRIEAGLSADYTETRKYGQEIKSISGNATNSALARAWMYRPISANENENLLDAPGDVDFITTSDFRINPVIDLENQSQHNLLGTLKANGYVEVKLTNYLSLRSTAGILQYKRRTEDFYNSKTAQGSPLNPNNRDGVWGYLGLTDDKSFSNENTLNFKNTFGDGHSINALALFGVNSYKRFFTSYKGTNLPNENQKMDGLDDAPTGTFSSPNIYNTENTMVSYAARVDYNFKSKYMLTLNFRADGSSKFLDHWGYFPGGAVAWNMDEEDFFKNAFPFISNAKIRASYGQNGNNRVGDFDAYPKLVLNNTGQSYSFNDQAPVPAAYLSTLGNSKLKWEKTKQTDIGIELGFLDNRIALEVDIYRKVTENLLLNADLPPSSGFSSARENVGKLKNEGIEVTLSTVNVRSGNFSWRSDFNISFNKNEIVALTYGQSSLSSNATYLSQFNKPLWLHEIGKPIGQMIGFVWDGNYQYEHFDNPAPGVYILKPSVPSNGNPRNTVQPGDAKYQDLNGDGTMSTADMTVIGRGQPIHVGGFSNNFSYKSFSLNLFFQWSYGNHIYNANRLLLEGNSNNLHGINQYASYTNRWTPENPTNANHRTRGQGMIGYFSSKHVEDGSYLRLKTISLGYSLPLNLIEKLSMSNLTIEVAGQNFLTWTRYSGLDPEVSTLNHVLQPGYDFSAYPQSRTIVVGLRASF